MKNEGSGPKSAIQNSQAWGGGGGGTGGIHAFQGTFLAIGRISWILLTSKP